jgi:hypothetical protein
MALEDFERFARLLTEENLRKDDVLRNQLNDAIMKGDDKAVVNIGRKYGHIFTTDDMLQYNEKYRKGAELTDEDIENVASILSPKSGTLALQAIQAVVYAVAYGVQASVVASIGSGTGAGILVKESSRNMLSQNLGQLMKAAGTETAALAAKTGVNKVFIEGIVSGGIDTEAGDELAPLRAIDKIAKHFGISLNHMINTELTPVTVFIPKAALDFFKRNPKLAMGLAARVSRYAPI